MVKKLFKHEFLHYLKSLLPFGIILIAMSCLNRLIQLFETNTDGYKIVFGSSIVMLVIGCLLTLIMCFVVSIKRFYKNLFTSEGYLSFTLPVTPTQHILVKLTSAVLFTLAGFLLVIIAVCISTSGEMLVEIIKAIVYLLKNAYFKTHIAAYMIEFAILMILALFSSYLQYYTCITIGQLAKKNRVAAAFGVYFIFYLATQFLSTVFIAIIEANPIIIDKISYLITNKLPLTVTLHGPLWIAMVISVIMSFVYFIVCRYIISKKLNLE